MSDSSIREYIGARYVPIFGRKDEESIEWDNTDYYEPLTIVLYEGNSYTSRQYVPVGIDIDNEEYWALTGNYNAQVELYRRETAAAQETAEDAQEDALEAVGTANEAKGIAEDIADKFDETTGIKIIPVVNYTAKYSGFIIQIPREYYKATICGYNGGNVGANNLTGYALDILNAHDNIVGIGNIGMDGMYLLNNVINGTGQPPASYAAGNQTILGLKPNGDIVNFAYSNYPNITAYDIRETYGCESAVMVYLPIREGGENSDISGKGITKEPRPFIGVDSQNYYIMMISGRTRMSTGITYEEAQTFFRNNYPSVNWYCYDGGGSTQFYIAGLKENIFPYKDQNLEYNYARARKTFIYFTRKDD